MNDDSIQDQITNSLSFFAYSELLINSNDRSIRYYQIEDEDTGIPVFRERFQDLINRSQWSQTCFNADNECVIGGSGHKAEHNIYIWDRQEGNLIKILEGPKEPLDDLAVRKKKKKKVVWY